MRSASLATYHPTGGIVAVESLAGRELATYVAELNEGVEGYSPTRRVFVNQDVLEPILARKATELGATVRNRTEATGLEQDDDGVTVTLRDLDGGGERGVRARYVVAADGNRSPMRAAARDRDGRPRRALAEHHDLLPRRLRAAAEGPQPGRHVRPQSRAARLLPARPHRRDRVPRHQQRRRGRHAAGGDQRQRHASPRSARTRCCRRRSARPTWQAEVLQIAHWRAEANVATRLREGRVFLAGDAAHVVPPNGGYGGNTGVLDARNLAWKLAAVVKGEASEGLLDSYDAERQPLGRLTVEQAYTRYATRVVPERGTDDAQPFIDDLTMELGLVVRSRAVVGDGSLADGVLHIPPVGGSRPARHARAARRARSGSLDARPVRARVRPAPAGRRRRLGAAGRSRARRSTPTGSPRPTASHRTAPVSCGPTASSDGARATRGSAARSPAHSSRSSPSRWRSRASLGSA